MKGVLESYRLAFSLMLMTCRFSTGGVRDRAVLETFYSTGMRRMELVNLKIFDVDFARGTVRTGVLNIGPLTLHIRCKQLGNKNGVTYLFEIRLMLVSQLEAATHEGLRRVRQLPFLDNRH